MNLCSYNRFLFVLFYVFFFSASAYAFDIRCVTDQSKCEISTNRLAIGDYIGVFSPDELLVAVGKVESINGLKRTIKMLKRYGKIYKGYEAVLIEDKQANDPTAYFKVPKAGIKQAVTARLGLLRMEAGDGLVGFVVSGAYAHRWRNIHILGRVGYLSVSGSATGNDTGVTQDARASAIMIGAGLAYRFLPNNYLSFDASVELGAASVTVNVADGGNATEILNRRIQPGLGLLVNSSIHAMFDFNVVRVGPGIGYTMVQNAHNLFMTIEANYAIN